MIDKSDIIVELLENFLYSIYSGKMEVTIEGKSINKSTMYTHIHRLLPKTKSAASFYSVICNNEDVIEEKRDFHGMGSLRLRLLYSADANKKVLVVRNSGMKISDIPSLPKGISFVGFLELEGENLNKFFRKMENPQHNKWEHKRHPSPEQAKMFKEEVELWVKSIIGEKIKEISGEEIDIDVSQYFYTNTKEDNNSQNEKVEGILDTIDTATQMEITQDNNDNKRFKIRDIGGDSNSFHGHNMSKGTIDDLGNKQGHRHRTGSRTGNKPTGRKGYSNPQGDDVVYNGMREVFVSARIIKKITVLTG